MEHLTYFHFWKHWIKPVAWPKKALDLPKIQAHRGFYKGLFKENSLESFRAAKDNGYLISELDLRLTRDSVIVVYHDHTLTRLDHRPEEIALCTAKELNKIAQIPTLEDVLSDSQMTPFFNLELKTKNLNDPLSEKLSKIILNRNLQDKVILSSFNPFSLFKLSYLLPDVPRALLITEVAGPLNYWWIKKMTLAPFLKLHMLNLHEDIVTLSSMKHWNNQKMPISVWTVKNKARYKHFMDLGVKSAIVDVTNRFEEYE